MCDLTGSGDGEMEALCHLLVDFVTTAAYLMKEISNQPKSMLLVSKNTISFPLFY